MAKKCSGLTASWCPIHGDCICLRDDFGEATDWYDDSRPGMNRPDCPLHGEASDHATPASIITGAEADRG